MRKIRPVVNRTVYFLIVMSLATVTLAGLMGNSACTQSNDFTAKQTKVAPSANQQTTFRHGIMRYTPEQRAAEEQLLRGAPPATVDKNILEQIKSSKTGTSFSLLPHISYVAHERDQGPNCGNCWVWACTGVLEVALDVQWHIKDRLSIQYVDHNYNGGVAGNFACCAGNVNKFINFYQNTQKAIPWSNTNAAFADVNCACSSGTASLPGAISTTPNYPISSIGPVAVIPTFNSSQADAIASIKYWIQTKNQPIVFLLMFPTDTQFQNFENFWDNNPEGTILAYNSANFGCNVSPTSPSGHYVLCVGWDDTTSNPYWIMLNSWGNGYQNNNIRPNGLFRIPMNYDYTCADASGQYNTWWITFPVTFIPSYIVHPYIGPAQHINNFTASRLTVPPGESAVLNWEISGEGDAYLTCGGDHASSRTASVARSPRPNRPPDELISRRSWSACRRRAGLGRRSGRHRAAGPRLEGSGVREDHGCRTHRGTGGGFGYATCGVDDSAYAGPLPAADISVTRTSGAGLPEERRRRIHAAPRRSRRIFIGRAKPAA